MLPSGTVDDKIPGQGVKTDSWTCWIPQNQNWNTSKLHYADILIHELSGGAQHKRHASSQKKRVALRDMKV